MKISSVCGLFLVVLTAYMFTTSESLFPDLAHTKCVDKATLMAGGRKLKENRVSIESNNKGDASRVTLDDYKGNGNDPAPTMKHVDTGPIEHEAPLIPYIPKLPPPPSPGNRENPVEETPGIPADYN